MTDQTHEQSDSLVTDEIVRRALGRWNSHDIRGWPHIEQSDRMRAALEAVVGDIIEEFGASGRGVS